MTEHSFVCVDRAVPRRYRDLADAHAAATRPDNAAAAIEAEPQRRFWATGSELRVRFLDIPQLTRRVMEAATSWTRYANLTLRVVSSGPAEIRVTFRGAGNWSALGTDALVTALYPHDGPTMCLPELPVAFSSQRVDHLVRHEFGHALGLRHEDARRPAGLRRQVVARGRSTVLAATPELDVRSVMLYAEPASRPPDGPPLPENPTLSPGDKELARRAYPGRR